MRRLTLTCISLAIASLATASVQGQVLNEKTTTTLCLRVKRSTPSMVISPCNPNGVKLLLRSHSGVVMQT